MVTDQSIFIAIAMMKAYVFFPQFFLFSPKTIELTLFDFFLTGWNWLVFRFYVYLYTNMTIFTIANRKCDSQAEKHPEELIVFRMFCQCSCSIPLLYIFSRWIVFSNRNINIKSTLLFQIGHVVVHRFVMTRVQGCNVQTLNNNIHFQCSIRCHHRYRIEYADKFFALYCSIAILVYSVAFPIIQMGYF